MKINGEEYGFLYSVGVHCDYEDLVISQPNMSISRAIVKKAVLMNAAYNKANGISGHDLTEEMIFALPDYVFTELRTAVESQEKADSTRTIETQALKGKN